MHNQLQAVLLAAGKSTRCNTEKSKLLEPICGQAMILYPMALLKTLAIPTTVIVGYQKEHLTEVIRAVYDQDSDIIFVTQEEQNGTAHAIACALDTLTHDHILIINGDMPLVTPEIIKELFEEHLQTQATVSFVTSHNQYQPGTYSRVLKTGKSIRIIPPEEKADSAHEYCCINAGIYIAKRDFLIKHIETVDQVDSDTDFCFTNIIKIASEKKYPMATISAPFDTIRGINNFEELWAAEQVKRSELIKYWMHKGVRFRVAQNVHIDIGVRIGAGTTIGAGVQLFSGTTIGKNCTIREFSSLEQTTIHDHVTVQPHCVLNNCTVNSHATVGPFAHIRHNSQIMDHATIGNFVEVKESTIGTKTKAKHLSYIGNTTIGAHVNIGAGTITANYDGTTHQETTIHDHAYIGSNTSIIAPVTIHEHALTGAGSVITKDVPAYALAIARSRQINKEEYRKKNQTSSQDHRTKHVASEAQNMNFQCAKKTDTDTTVID